jgi:hypothetical protein
MGNLSKRVSTRTVFPCSLPPLDANNGVPHTVRYNFDFCEVKDDSQSDRPSPVGLLQDLLTQLPNLVQVAATSLYPGSLPGVSKCFNILASMPHLKALDITKAETDELESWAVPFASGGLSHLSLRASDYDRLTGVEAFLAFHADTLRWLKVYGIDEWGPRPEFKLNRLESLSLSRVDMELLKRFTSCPIEPLEVTLPSSQYC